MQEEDPTAGGCCAVMTSFISACSFSKNKSENTPPDQSYAPDRRNITKKPLSESVLTTGTRDAYATMAPYRPSEQRRHSTERLISLVSASGTRVSNRDLSRMSQQSRASFANTEFFPDTLRSERSRVSTHSLKSIKDSMTSHKEQRKTGNAVHPKLLDAIVDEMEVEENIDAHDGDILNSAALKALGNHQERRRSSYNSNQAAYTQRRASMISDMGRISVSNYAPSSHGSRKSIDCGTTELQKHAKNKNKTDQLTIQGGRKSASNREMATRIPSASSDRPTSANCIVHDDVNYKDTDFNA